MGCSSSSQDEKKNLKPLSLSSDQKNTSAKQAKTENIKGSLGNRPVNNYNESALRVTKYFKDQQPPSGNQPWTDDLFPPTVDSVFGRDSNGNPTDNFTERTNEYRKDFKVSKDDVQWFRADEIFPGKHTIFEDNIDFSDIKQGSVGDCYFMSALASLTEYPELIVEIFRTLKVNQNGCYEVVMRINGKWQIVLLDNYFPCDKNKKILFSKPNGSEIWVMLLEKAWAKVNGGYLNIVSGLATDVLFALTNFPVEYIRIENKVEANKILWEKIKNFESNGYIMATSTGSKKMDDVGLVGGHAFSLISVKEGNVNGKIEKLLKIRNPWGYKEWSGKWSDKSNAWTDEAKKEFGYSGNMDDGTFFMSYDDYLKYFSTLEVCYRQSNLCSKYLECDSENIYSPHVYELVVDSQSSVCIQAIKRYYRFKREIPPDAEAIMNVIICQKINNNELKWIKGNGDCQKNPLTKVDLNPGKYLIYVIPNFSMSTYDKPRKWVVDVTSSGYFDLQFKGYDSEDYVLLKSMAYSFIKSKANLKGKNVTELYPAIDETSIGAIYLGNNSGANYIIDGCHDLVGMRDLENRSTINIPLVNGDYAIILTTRDDFYTAFSCGTGGYSYNYGESEIPNRDIGHFMEDIDVKDLTNVENYTWLHKQIKLNISKIAEKIDQNEIMMNFIKSTYPQKYEKLVLFKGPSDGVKVEFQDVYEFGGSNYLGQWRVDNPVIRHGIGYYDWYSIGNWYAGEFKDNKFHGKGMMGWPTGSYIEIGFVNGEMDGEGIQYENAGDPGNKCKYSNGNFVSWL